MTQASFSKNVLAAVAVLAIGGAAVAQETTTSEKSGATMTLAGVQVIHRGYGEGFKGLRPFNSAKVGARVAFLVNVPKGGLISVNRKESTLEYFKDDTGKSLFKGESPSYHEGWGHWPKIADDKKAAMVEIVGEAPPAAGAKALKVKGTLSVTTASQLKTLKSGVAEAKADAKFKIEGIEWTVKKPGKPKWGKKAFQLSLSIEKDIKEIAKFRFLDEQGKEIPHKAGGSSRFSSGDSVTVEKSFQFDKKFDKFTLSIDVYTDLKEHTIKFEKVVEIGAGK